MKIELSSPIEVVPGGERVAIVVSEFPQPEVLYDCTLFVDGKKIEERGFRGRGTFELPTSGYGPGEHEIIVRAKAPDAHGGEDVESRASFRTTAAEQPQRPVPFSAVGPIPVTLQRTAPPATNDLPLWLIIRNSSEAISFNNYSRMMDLVICNEPPRAEEKELVEKTKRQYETYRRRRALPFTDVDAYRLLKAATEAFLVVNCGVPLSSYKFSEEDVKELKRRAGVETTLVDLKGFWAKYLQIVNGIDDPIIPYLALIRAKLKDLQFAPIAGTDTDLPDHCFDLLREKFTSPCLIELIWSYWHEEGMLVQTLNAISRRFQNVRGHGAKDPLAHLEIDPLRPLNNLLWGYIQDDQHRLTIKRRAYEYDHHYGLSLVGKAVPALRPADSRSKFLEAFHRLLHISAQFFLHADDTTVVPDGFPVLNALKEVHLLLSEGMHNQFGELPATARIEMLMQQWLLARPEFREFLPSRTMTAYGEAWMDRVETMKKLQGWTDTTIVHFRDLAVFGERLLLSVRFGAWNDIDVSPDQAAHWARFWRGEIQGYVHAYRAVTGVDLNSEPVDATVPSFLLAKRLSAQRRAIRS